jgi:hypothetical protein
MVPETPRSASPLSPALWRPKRKKNYPHFDDQLSDKEIHALVTNPVRVGQNPFLPFIVFKKKFNRFGKGGPRKEREKSRELRYAARKDAYIYEYYRQKLSVFYETELTKRGLSDVVIAYRKLKGPTGRGMCSVDFARNAFAEIHARKNCVGLALDISGYFESLDHNMIKKQWCALLGIPQLPKDQYSVFRAITRYSQIYREDVYKKLDIIVWDAVRSRWKYRVKKDGIPLQLCSVQEFRSRLKNLVWTNWLDHGIPQGSPISDLIANFYLLDFDEILHSFAKSIGGYYRRYCDDILIVFSNPDIKWMDVESFISSELGKCGSEISIKPEKTCVHQFSDTKPRCVSLKGDQKRFEYLGFQFDGAEARFRDRTVSAFYRKLKWAIYAEARRTVRKYPKKTAAFIEGKIDASKLMQRFGRTKGFSESDDVHGWTFWTYVNRSAKIMGSLGPNLHRQIENYKKFVRYHLPLAVEKAFEV